MASAAVQPPVSVPNFNSASQPLVKEVSKPSQAQKQSRDITAEVNYFDISQGPPKPAIIGQPQTYDQPKAPRRVTIHDARGKEDQLSLDGNGFQYVRYPSAEKEFKDDEKIKRDYYPEVERILKEATGASKVFVFDHTIRRPPPPNTTLIDNQLLRGPVTRVHIDQSYKAGPDRVRHHFPDAAEHERLLRGRYQIINVWRPIKTIHKDPLAVAEANSVSDDDLLPAQLVYPDKVGETFAVAPGEGHKWFYLHEQTPEEVTLIKCFDSVVDGRARRVPHTAFVDEEYVDREPRESIEVRALVFHEPSD